MTCTVSWTVLLTCMHMLIQRLLTRYSHPNAPFALTLLAVRQFNVVNQPHAVEEGCHSNEGGLPPHIAH